MEQRWAGPLSPEFSGGIVAVQLGLDLIKYASSGQGRAGVFFAHSETWGDGRGSVLGTNRTLAGTLNMDTNNIGAYWTHIGPSQWYVDAVLMGTFFDADPRSSRGIGANLNGTGVTASLEAGVPFRLAPNLSLEAQGQLIWQQVHFDQASDPFTTLRFNLDNSFVGRFGLRLEGDVWFNGTRLQPFVLANLWHAFGGTDFDGVQQCFHAADAVRGNVARDLRRRGDQARRPLRGLCPRQLHYQRGRQFPRGVRRSARPARYVVGSRAINGVDGWGGLRCVGDQLLQPSSTGRTATVCGTKVVTLAVVPPKPGLEWRLRIGAIIAQTPPDRYAAISASANSLI